MAEKFNAKKYGEEYVEVVLIKDTGRNSGDVFIGVNGENCVVKRGVPVRIKRKFANAMNDSEVQRSCADRVIEELAKC